jgi:hypothetical protein
MLRTGSAGRTLALLTIGAALIFATAGASADTFAVNLVSQDATTVTLGWSPQPGYGYLFSKDGQLVSRTNDPNRSTVRFAKATSYDIDVIAKGANGHYPSAPPPPPKAQCEDGADNDGDGKVDLADPGCSGPTDNDETNAPPPPPGCNLNATPANFAAQVSAATPGQTVCLSSGNYGTFNGTNKAITIAADSGATPQMQINLGSGDTGFTLGGMTGMGGDINGATNITIKNSAFTDSIDFEGNNTAIVLDHNTHNWNARYSGGINAKLFCSGDYTGTVAAPSVTIRNSEIKNGDLDGVHLDCHGYLILNNVFDNLCDVGSNHTDNIQFQGGQQDRIAGNYFHTATCETQGITSYDSGTVGIIVENNVVDITRLFGIELYSDRDSVVRHNTVVYRAPNTAGCGYGSSCGRIDISRKTQDPAGTGTHVYDNITSGVSFSAGSTGTADHNVSGQTAVYVGPPTTHDGYLLAVNSPVGRGAASDGTNAGVYP